MTPSPASSPARPRIYLVNRYFFPDESATSQLLTDLARHLAARCEVHVLTSRQLLEAPKAALAGHDQLDDVTVHRLWSTSLGRRNLPGRLLDYLSFLVAAGLWLLFRARAGDLVLAKTDPPLLGVVTTLATLGRGVRRLQWLQDLYPETATALGVAGAGPLTQRLRDWSLRRTRLVVTASGGMLDYLRPRAGPAMLVHIPNWADDHGATSFSTGSTLVIGYSGNLGRAHPIDGLMPLADLARKAPVRFIITGGGAHHERLKAHVAQLGVKNWTFQPYQPRERLGETLRRPQLHIVTLDPRVERFIFPSKVYGILSAARPILNLGIAGGEVALLVREHHCGWTLPADDAPRMLALLLELRASPARLQEAGRNARVAYERHYSRDAALAQWDAGLQTV